MSSDIEDIISYNESLEKVNKALRADAVRQDLINSDLNEQLIKEKDNVCILKGKLKESQQDLETQQSTSENLREEVVQISGISNAYAAEIRGLKNEIANILNGGEYEDLAPRERDLEVLVELAEKRINNLTKVVDAYEVILFSRK